MHALQQHTGCPVHAQLNQHPAPPRNRQVLEGLFLFCCVWSLGACLVQRPEARERERFDAFVRRLAGMAPGDGDM